MLMQDVVMTMTKMAPKIDTQSSVPNKTGEKGTNCHSVSQFEGDWVLIMIVHCNLGGKHDKYGAG